MSDYDLKIIELVFQFIQTLVVIGSVAVVRKQLQMFRKDSIEAKISGLKAAIDTLETDLFTQASTSALAGTSIGTFKWRRLLDDINFVAYLVEQDYTDAEGLLRLKGAELAAIGKYIKEHPIKDIQDDAKGRYKLAMELMNWAIAKRTNE